jgi:hypothetical protein
MNAGTLPRTPPTPPCLPPDGMIEGAKGTALEIFRAGQAEEQECLFYVALSRTGDRLFIYSPTLASNGSKRSASEFLDRVGPGLARKRITPSRALPTTPEDETIKLVVPGKLIFGAPQIALYEACPRRFFYTHLLRVGGGRTATPFMRMHEAIRTVLETILGDASAVASDAALEQRIVDACAAQGLADHGYIAEFRDLALTLLRYFLWTRRGMTLEAPAALRLVLDGEEIIARPDDVLVRPDGQRVLRRIRTGHRRSDSHDDVGAAAFLLAARAAFPSAIVELVHLSDQEILPIDPKPKTLENRRGKLVAFLAKIRAGDFPTNPSTRTCPGCPAFFICGPAPAGVLKKKFDDPLPVAPARVD